MHSALDSSSNFEESGIVTMNPLLSLLKKRRLRRQSSFVFFSFCFGVEEYSQDLMAKNSAPVRSWPMAVFRGLDESL